MLKKIIRLNLTNRCDMACGTCYISANPNKNGFLQFSDLQDILNEHQIVPLEVVFEGGEPFLHQRLFLFLEYLDTLSNVKRVIISTNGHLSNETYIRLLDTINRLRIQVQLNVGITTHLINEYEFHLLNCKHFVEDIRDIFFDVTYMDEEDKAYLTQKIKEHDIPLERCVFSIVKAYGALKDSEYPNPCNCYDDNNIFCYATDGTGFGDNIEKRAEYELALCYNEIPTFDLYNHRQMWMLTHAFIADITFENQDNCKQSIKDLQLEYNKQNTCNNVYGSYIREFKRLYGDIEPFYIENAELLEDEVIDGLSYLMETTIDMKRFYEYKELALKLCREIAYLVLRDEIKTIKEFCCK
jgi:organic radical activating enzyme